MKNIYYRIALLLFLLAAPGIGNAENMCYPCALDANNYSELDLSLNNIQNNFESGKISEIELRNAYRPFYTLTAKQAWYLQEWAKSSPKSYPAHLALGIYLKKRGEYFRGKKSIAETLQFNLDKMEELDKLSKSELDASLSLTSKPYLSYFHLLQISTDFGNDKASEYYFTQGRKILPRNRLIRNRYFISLTPRWGGSYLRMKNFIADAKAKGADAEAIAELEALTYDDLGQTALDNRDRDSAIKYFLLAMERAKNTDRTFKEDSLTRPALVLCSTQKYPEYCQ